MNVKPGDLAIVSGPTHHAGKIVEVVRVWSGQAIDGVQFHNCRPGMWICAMGRPVPYRGTTMHHGPFPDEWLRPVSGLQDFDGVRRHSVT